MPYTLACWLSVSAILYYTRRFLPRHGYDKLPLVALQLHMLGSCWAVQEPVRISCMWLRYVLSIYLRPKRRVLKVSKMERPCKIYSNRSKSYLAAVFAYRSSKAPLKSSKIQRICRWHLGSQVIPLFVSRIVAQNKYIKRTMDLNRTSAPKKLRVSWNDPPK